MALGSDIELPADIPISPRLLENLDYLQDIFTKWSGHFRRNLKKVAIRGGVEVAATEGLDKTLSFFSGGIDGAYTFLRNEKEIDLLMFAKGIDMQLSSDDLFIEALKKNTGYLNSKGKEIYPIETNVRFLGHEHGLSWTLCFGGGLASIALAANARKSFIASGLTYANKDYEGCNFITDHLWSNEYTQIVHDGAEADRNGKLLFVSSDLDYMNILRVCWQDRGYNCGECEKCLRTMTSLRALGLSSSTFPELTDGMIKKNLGALKLYNEHDLEFIQASLRDASKAGDKKLVDALKRLQRSYEVRFIYRSIKKLLRSN